MHILVLSFLLMAHVSSYTIPGVPFVMQATQYCGPASLSSVLAYHGDTVDQHAIGMSVYDPKLRGSLITDLENFARGRGFHARSARGGIEDIKEALSDNRPVIVLVDSGFWIASRLHYLVVFGFNNDGFVAHTGYKEARVFSYRDFGKIWQKAGNTYLLVYP